MSQSYFFGTLYLIHFEHPYVKAQHYLGFTQGDAEERAREHRKGQGSPLLKAVTDAGISWWVVRTFPGDRNTERRLKKHKNLRRYCPACNPDHWETGWTDRGRKKDATPVINQPRIEPTGPLFD